MNNKTEMRLLVIGFAGAVVGAVSPAVGMKTKTGDVVKVNPKSMVIRDENGEERPITLNHYQPSVPYSLLSDNELELVTLFEDKAKEIQKSEAIRQFSKLDSADLVNAISDAVDANLTANAYRREQTKPYDNFGDFSAEVKLGMMQRILNPAS